MPGMPDTPEYDIVVRRGQVFRLVFEWQDDDEEPVPLTGYLGRMQIRSAKSEVLMELTTEAEDDEPNIRLEPDAGIGEVHLYIGADDTADLPAKGRYDLELYKDDDPDEVEKLIKGRVRLEDQITVTAGE